jgi:hypothetical protein
MYKELKCPYCGLSVGSNIENNIAACQHCRTSVLLEAEPNLLIKRLLGIGKNSKWRTKVILNDLEVTKIFHGGSAAFVLPVGAYKIVFMASKTIVKSYEFEITDDKTRVFIDIYTGKKDDKNSMLVTSL